MYDLDHEWRDCVPALAWQHSNSSLGEGLEIVILLACDYHMGR